MSEKMNEQTANNISEWLREYINNNGLTSLIVGVSGGVDSALTSILCARTGLNTILVKMPIHSEKKGEDLSALHCQWLTDCYNNVSVLNIDLTEVYDSFENTVPFKNNLALANTKSRIRMIMMYYLASQHSGVVVGTGNKVEDFGVGFYTKYGDGGVDISPIADLTKTQVRELAACLGVSKDILEAPPTDGLWEDNRTDEEQLGASYEELEWAMDYADGQKENNLSARQKEVLEIFLLHRGRNKHKMLEIPIYKLNKEEK